MKIVGIASRSLNYTFMPRAIHSRFKQYLGFWVATLLLLMFAGTAYADHDISHVVQNMKGGLSAIEQRLWDCEHGNPVTCPGTKGDKGDTGADGLAGETGPKGDTGDTGPQGSQGEQGAGGAKGDTGAAGATGATGPQGIQGIAGNDGIDGAKGDKGDTGDIGPQGPAGSGGDNPLSILNTWFNQPGLVNAFPVDTFKAVQCSQEAVGDISVNIGGQVFHGVAFIGFDAISQTHAYFTAFTHTSLINGQTLAGANASVTINNGVETGQFSGVVTEGGLIAADASGFIYGIKIEPQLSLLDNFRDYSIYQELNIQNVIESNLSDAGFSNFQFLVNGTLLELDFVMQYNQSDLDFISNRMEEAGLSYYFSDAGQMIITDMPGTGTVDSTYAGHLLPGGSLVVLNRAIGIAGHSFTVDSYDYKKSVVDLQSTVTNSAGIGTTYEFEQSLREISDTATYADILSKRSISATDRLSGSGILPAFRSGKIAKIDDMGGDLSGQYLLTRVDHVALKDNENNCVTYANRFDATTNITSYRPSLKTPKPTVSGVTTAIVTGPAGEEIYVDEHGRVKVQFQWDQQGLHNENSSAWLRVMLPAGRIDTEFYLPEVDDEVVVTFLEGNPDRPLVLGTVYNDLRRPYLPLPNALFP